MREELSVFDFGEHAVRVLLDESGEPLFVAKDVCAVLELQNPTMVMGGLDDDEVTKLNLGGQHGLANLVTESGLYHLIFKSRKAAARKFRRWVTMEVLPELRVRGFYGARRDAGVKLSLLDWIKGRGFELKTDYAKIMPELKRVWCVAKDLGVKVEERDERGYALFDSELLDIVEGGVAGQLGLDSVVGVDFVERVFERMVVGVRYSVTELADLLGMEGAEPRLRNDVGGLMKRLRGCVVDGRRVARVVEGRRVYFVMEEVAS